MRSYAARSYPAADITVVAMSSAAFTARTLHLFVLHSRSPATCKDPAQGNYNVRFYVRPALFLPDASICPLCLSVGGTMRLLQYARGCVQHASNLPIIITRGVFCAIMTLRTRLVKLIRQLCPKMPYKLRPRMPNWGNRSPLRTWIRAPLDQPNRHQRRSWLLPHAGVFEGLQPFSLVLSPPCAPPLPLSLLLSLPPSFALSLRLPLSLPFYIHSFFLEMPRDLLAAARLRAHRAAQKIACCAGSTNPPHKHQHINLVVVICDL